MSALRRSLAATATIAALVLVSTQPAFAVDVHRNQCLSGTATAAAQVGSTMRTVSYDVAGHGGVYLNLGPQSYCSAAFPGGTMHINTVKCEGSPAISSERSFTSSLRDQCIATNVFSPTCFRVRWRGTVSGTFRGVIFWWQK